MSAPNTLTKTKLESVSWVNRLFAPRRLTYAKLLGGILWTVWVISLVLGEGYKDLAGLVIGTDFLQYYTAGYILHHGDSARLYDLLYQVNLHTHIIGAETAGFYGFILPPFMAWLFYPLALLPYPLSFAVWCVLCLTMLWLSLKLLASQTVNRTFIWALTWFPVFAAISFGQNSLLSLFLFALTYHLWLRERPFGAGMAASLLAYKPQLLLAVGFLWLLRWRKDWRALLGLGLGVSVLVLLCFITLPAASWSYVDFARTVIPNIPNWAGRQLWHTQTIFEFWLLLLPEQREAANVLRWLFVGIGSVAFVYFLHRHREEKPLLYAGMMGFLIWIAPHANIYEMSLLLIPAVLLWEHRPDLRSGWRAAFILLWLAFLFSGPLTYVQLEVLRLPFAMQISVPVWAMAMYLAYGWLMASLDKETVGITA